MVINPFVQEAYHLEAKHYRLFPIRNAIGEHFFVVQPRPRERNLILAIGHVYRLKGQDVLLKALLRLKQRGVMARATIIGPASPSEYLSMLQKFVRDNGLTVEFTGFLSPEQALSHLQQCALLVLPSRFDTSPMVIAEAMATGTPVIASRVAGLPHMIAEGETGLLVEPENDGELADKIQYLLENEDVRCCFGEAGRKYALENHHPDRVAQLTHAAYEAILADERA